MSIAVGAMCLLTDESIGPSALARELEERGFESLFLPEHTHIPASQATDPTGGALRREYYRTVDPFAALATAAAVTSRIKLGTAVCLVAQHHPINLAKSVATVDLVSEGRFVFGVGFGWNKDEARSHGIAFGKRREIVRERVLAMKALWTDERATFSGSHVELPPTFQWPKPVQKPHPPVLIGGSASPRVFDAVIGYGDGWIPVGGPRLADDIEKLRARAEAAGRDPSEIRLSVISVDAKLDDGTLLHYEELGVERLLLWVPSAGRETVLPVLDRYVHAVAR